MIRLKDILNEIFHDRSLESEIERIEDDIQVEFMNKQKHQSWKLVPARDLLVTWNTFGKYGRVDEDKLEKIWELVRENAIKILINSDVTNGLRPEMWGHDEYEEITVEDWKRW